MANNETANPRISRNHTNPCQWARVRKDWTQRKNSARSAEYLRSSMRVKNGTTVMPTVHCTADTTQKATSGHNSGFQTNWNSSSINALDTQTSSRTPAPTSRTASDHGSTAPCASTAKATSTQ